MHMAELSWGALLFYYKSVGDKKYFRMMSDHEFLTKLRTKAAEVSLDELESKLVLDFINVPQVDALKVRTLATNIQNRIARVQEEIVSLQNRTLIECDLSDSSLTDRIMKVYSTIGAIEGIWITGSSKIVHILNDRLFPILNPTIANRLFVKKGERGMLIWLEIVQGHAKEVARDFLQMGLSGTPEKYLSQKLGYSNPNFEKSLVRFLDEYFWISLGDNLPIPPVWIPTNERVPQSV